MQFTRRDTLKLLGYSAAWAHTRGAFGQAATLPITSGPFTATRSSLDAYTVPDWFRGKIRYLVTLGAAVRRRGWRLVCAEYVYPGNPAVRVPPQDVRTSIQNRLQRPDPLVQGGQV